MGELNYVPSILDERKIYGLIAEFDSPSALRKAAKKTYEAGFQDVEAYSPFPSHNLAEDMGVTKTRVPLATLIGGITGGSLGFGMLTFCHVFNYPLNIGGRQLFSWPMFLPITFEMTVLFAAFTCFISLLRSSGLPRPYHPVFNSQNFERATSDGFFLIIASIDKKFETEQTKSFLQGLSPKAVSEVYP